LLTSAPAGGFLACGPQLCHKFHDGGHRRGKFHYTHEAEERNKIKFLILVESFINFIHCLLSSLRFSTSLGCASSMKRFQGGIKQMLD